MGDAMKTFWILFFLWWDGVVRLLFQRQPRCMFCNKAKVRCFGDYCPKCKAMLDSMRSWDND